ncbi:unnamed protein product [Parnassius apollo]|uniref:(apollo) hypothetical protein n=1 Tax=Parnassius apollo TaxID=110799 RepID=A0A8S3XRS1_PARAO|nr:unnamed protein product [Parnassius apollo]
MSKRSQDWKEYVLLAGNQLQEKCSPSLSEAILPDIGSSSDLNIFEPPPLPQQNLHTTHVRSNPTIRSSVNKRAASTSNHCISCNCFETEHLLVHSSIKDLLLLNNKFYVPPTLSIYLVNLRTGDSNERLVTLFNKSRVTIERLMNKARTCLINEFAPLYLGFNPMTVEDVASRNRIIPDRLFGNPDLPPNSKPAIVICDATYVFIQSSS